MTHTTTSTTSTDTAKILKAAKGYKQWGKLPAQRYAQRHRLPPRLVQLARQLEAVATLDAPRDAK